MKKLSKVALLLCAMAAGYGGILPDQRNTVQETLVIRVQDERKQQIRLGIDAERLWHWHSSIKEELADAAVGELQAAFVRIGISAEYERERGIKNEGAYDQILEVMTEMRNINPKIHFFASPRPMHEAYSRQEKTEIWGHPDNVPFSPFPVWIQQWHKSGTKKLKGGTVVPRWAKGEFDVEALVQYYADYLNLMHDKGFVITYLDVTNEQTIVTPEHTKYLHEQLPPRLNQGVSMPKLIAPSSWSIEGGIDWLKAIDRTKGQHLAFAIAAAHNTGSAGDPEVFVREAKRIGKEVWNTELHGWIGTKPEDEILNSAVFWRHLKAGFTGFATWLFYGPIDGRNHTMINSNGKQINRSTKYEIFKQVVNNANGGYYVDVSSPSSAIHTAGFIKGDVLSVWVLNTGDSGFSDAVIRLPREFGMVGELSAVKWQKQLPSEGQSFKLEPQTDRFTIRIDGKSLYFFKIQLVGDG